MNKRVVGVDIGGANLKYARLDDRFALANTFPMWRVPDQLADTLKRDLRSLGKIDSLAVTMTGELADCFVDRQVGVRHIVQHVQAAANEHSITEVAFYGVDGQFHDAASAIENVDTIAAANWHALASYVGQEIKTDSLLVDIGSTTTDIIPISGGRVATKAQTDFDRLLDGSLVYVGCRRTPVCAIVDRLMFRGQECSVMNELFATIDDARIVLSRVEPQSKDCDSADGKPRMIEFAANRLARMIGLDRRTVTIAEAQKLGQQVLLAASERIAAGIDRQRANLATNDFVVSGHGHDLLDYGAMDLPSDHTSVSLSNVLGEAASRAAPAYAVAGLLSGRLRGNP